LQKKVEKMKIAENNSFGFISLLLFMGQKYGIENGFTKKSVSTVFFDY
jgi:hypothetical protein